MNKEIINKIKTLVSLPLLLAFVVSCDPVENLYKVIRKNGYIVYHTPLQYAGTGTLIGGSPKKLSLIAPPQTCFPDEINGVPTNLRFRDYTSLPERDYHTSMKIKLALEFMKYMPVDKPDTPPFTLPIPGLGNLPIQDIINLPGFPKIPGLPNFPFPIDKELGGGDVGKVTSSDPSESTPPQTIELGFSYSKVKNVYMSFEGAEVEYIDSVQLARFYKNNMSEDCKEHLDYVGFVSQALKVNKLRFSFEGEQNGLIDLSLMNINEIVKLDPRLEWKIVKKVYLEFDSPRYIGYQVGRLSKEDAGMAYYRASEAKRNKFNFKLIGLFQPEQEVP